MNNSIKEFTYFNELLDLYKNLLTPKQRDVLVRYYEYNLSLSEISEELNITRSAVSDAIEHAKEKIINYEKSLKLNEKIHKIIDIVDKSNLSKEEKNEIIKELTDGIWGITR